MISITPIISRKPSASITTDGCRAMKAEIGPDATNISPTAISTATIMIGK